MKYTTKKNAIDKGLCHRGAAIYKKSLLERWYDKGWLELPNSKYSADARLRAGLRLALDYYIVNKNRLHSGFALNDKVDVDKFLSLSDKNEAENRYRKAIKNIPDEFWAVVRKVCIEEEEPVPPPALSDRQKAYFYFLCRIDLCRGLDRLLGKAT